jgi:hypothetical protein
MKLRWAASSHNTRRARITPEKNLLPLALSVDELNQNGYAGLPPRGRKLQTLSPASWVKFKINFDQN